MRKAICTLLYRLGMRRLAYKVSPSVYGYLFGEEVAAKMAAALQCAGGFAAALKEGGADNG